MKDSVFKLTIDFIDSLGGSKVDISRQFTNNHDVDTLDDFSLEGGSIDQLGKDLGRSKVGKESHGGSHLQKSTFGTQFSRVVVPFESTDAGQEHRVGGLALFEGFLGEGIVDSVNGGTSNQSLLEVQRESLLFAESREGNLGGCGDFGSDSVSRKKGDGIGILFRNGVEGRVAAGSRNHRLEGGDALRSNSQEGEGCEGRGTGTRASAVATKECSYHRFAERAKDRRRQ